MLPIILSALLSFLIFLFLESQRLDRILRREEFPAQRDILGYTLICFVIMAVFLGVL
jgi:hypothetical protein